MSSTPNNSEKAVFKKNEVSNQSSKAFLVPRSAINHSLGCTYDYPFCNVGKCRRFINFLKHKQGGKIALVSSGTISHSQSIHTSMHLKLNAEICLCYRMQVVPFLCKIFIFSTEPHDINGLFLFIILIISNAGDNYT